MLCVLDMKVKELMKFQKMDEAALRDLDESLEDWTLMGGQTFSQVSPVA